jgi:phytanoyl-CoA hydroxylase
MLTVSPHDDYVREGYCVVRGLVPEAAIDRVLAIYGESVLPSQKPFFRQSTNRWTRTRVNRFGHALDSFRDPHDYPAYSVFCGAVRDLLCCTEIQQCLRGITHGTDHSLVQSMMFDQNTTTPPHQDWYYLDSIPNGRLLAAWIALEDIHEDAGRFFVVPKSHEMPFDPANSSDINTYMKTVEDWFAKHSDQAHAPAMRKGDVLFWNSRTIHGSLPTRDEKYSRMSLTAHYLPSQYQFGARNQKTPTGGKYERWNGMQVRLALPIHKHYSLSALAQTELFTFMYERPLLRRLALAAAQLVKR